MNKQRIELAKKMLADIDALKEAREEKELEVIRETEQAMIEAAEAEAEPSGVEQLSSTQIRVKKLADRMKEKSREFDWWSDNLANNACAETWEAYFNNPDEFDIEQAKKIRDLLYLPYCMWRNLNDYIRKAE